MPDAGAQIGDEFERVVSAVEEMTGLKSRWRGEVRVIQPQDRLFASRQFSARKDWDCGLTVASSLASNHLRWRTLIHEGLHSVSVGLNAQDYRTHLGWEEATVEALQRQIRPAVLARLGVSVDEATFAAVEANWLYERYVAALRRVAAEFGPLSETEFFQTLLGERLRGRRVFVLARGKRMAPDFERFKRVYAAASGSLSQ